MNASAIFTLTPLLAAGPVASTLPALRVVFTIALILFLGVGWFIFRNRHRFFDRDPQVDNDFLNVREVRMENILTVWGALTLMLFRVCVAVWSA